MAAIAKQRFQKNCPIDELNPSDPNPNRGNLDAIQASIDANTFYSAIIAQESTGRILAGNHRWRAAQAAGMASVPVLWIDVDNRTADRIMLADNRTAELSETDHETLNDLLRMIGTEDGTLTGTGYDDKMLPGLLGTFEPGIADDQPRLDQTKEIECPNCQHRFSR